MGSSLSYSHVWAWWVELTWSGPMQLAVQDRDGAEIRGRTKDTAISQLVHHMVRSCSALRQPEIHRNTSPTENGTHLTVRRWLMCAAAAVGTLHSLARRHQAELSELSGDELVDRIDEIAYTGG